MAYENVKISTSFPNFTVVDGYFYNLNHTLDTLVCKTADGNTAFSYPLDTVVTKSIKDIEYIGTDIAVGDFWTMEYYTDEDADSGTILKRWQIDNYTLKLQQTISLPTNATDTFQCDNFAIEHYDISFGTNEATGQTNLTVSSSTRMAVGTVLCLGPSTYTGSEGSVQRVTVTSMPTPTTVVVTPALTANYASGDPISFYKDIWLFNDYYLKANTGGLYKINSTTGSITLRDSNGVYNGVDASTFTNSGDDGYIVYMKADALRYIDANDVNLDVYQQALQDNRTTAGAIISVVGLAIENANIYRLQQSATYQIGDTSTTYSWSTLNYQLATTTPFVSSVSVTATPSIVAADGVTESTLVATVRDQFNNVMASKTVDFAEDDDEGAGAKGYIKPGYTTVITNAAGQATSYYVAGTAANQVTITVTVNQ